MPDPNGLGLLLLLTVLPAIAGWDASGGNAAIVGAAPAGTSLLRAAASQAGESQLVLSVAGEGIVTSTGAAPDLNCTKSGGSGCTGGFAAGSEVGTLTAKTSVGYTFVGWRSQGTAAFSGCHGTPCTLTKSASTEYVTAVFEKNAAVNPLVLYTDIASGPNAGGENDDGIYLTVFGKNFGSGTLGVTVKVYVNDVEVKRYMNSGLVPV